MVNEFAKTLINPLFVYIIMGFIENLLSISNEAKLKASKYIKKRFIFENVKKINKSNLFVGIAGLRGVGKTILLLQLALENKDSIYISLDLLKEKFDLYELVKELNQKYGLKYFYLDEIHNYLAWQQDLKKIYELLKVKLVFTSSIAIEVIESKYDLSRRVNIVKMYPFSFKEFLYFKINENIDLDFKKIFDYDSNKILIYQAYYQEYISGGSLPASFESESGIIIPNILDKIIHKDLVAIKKLGQEDIFNLNQMLKYIAGNPIEIIGYSNISKNLGISKYKVQQYLEHLEKAFVINIIFPNTRNVLKEPKILFSLPFRYFLAKDSNEDFVVGALREDFFVFQNVIKSNKIYYLKDKKGKKLPDYLVVINNEKYIFEIGGKNKSNKQIVEVSNKIKSYLVQNPLGRDDALPLIAFGF